MQTIAKRILHYRTALNISQEELGKRVEEITGIATTRMTISSYEVGRRKVPVNLIGVFSEIFDVNPAALLYSTEDLVEKFANDDLLTQRLEENDREIERLKLANQRLQEEVSKQKKVIVGMKSLLSGKKTR